MFLFTPIEDAESYAIQAAEWLDKCPNTTECPCAGHLIQLVALFKKSQELEKEVRELRKQQIFKQLSKPKGIFSWLRKRLKRYVT